MTSFLEGRLLVGGSELCEAPDYEAVLHATKTCHKRMVGFAGTYANPWPEYLVADRDNNLYLNLVDTPDPAYIVPECMAAGVDFIRLNLEAGKQVVVHCDEGKSRAPSLALLYLAGQGMTLAEFEAQMPEYHPGLGLRVFVAKHWSDYARAGVPHG